MVKKTSVILSIFCLSLLFVLALAFSPANVQAQPTRGSNWNAQFYNNANFVAPVVGTAVYPNGLIFTWAGLPLQADGVTPVAGVTVQDGFSVIFTTQFNFTAAGTYNFFGRADDQIRITFNNAAIFNTTNPPAGTQPVNNFSVNFNVPTPGTYPIQIALQEFGGSATLDLQWQFGTGTGVVATPVPTGPIGSVVQVRGLSLRTGPYLGASFVAVLRPGVAYPVSAKNSTEGGPYTWYRVTAGERTGWASGRYMTVTLLEQVPEATTIFQELIDPPDTGVTGYPRAIMNLRIYPSERSPRIAQIPWGAPVSILNRTIQGGQNKWLQVRYITRPDSNPNDAVFDGAYLVGWIAAPYVQVNGLIDLVPVR